MKQKERNSSLPFNDNLPTIMHIDINSCFATIEQQANPLLRGKPIAVGAYDTPKGVILAASIEAKIFGVKTGMRVYDAKKLCPTLHVMTGDPNKYRFVHVGLRELLKDYTDDLFPKSIDEFVLNLKDYVMASLSYGARPSHQEVKNIMLDLGNEIKKRIRQEIGDWISVSIGIGPSRFIAKTASNYEKPDGLVVIDASNFLEVYSKMKLTDIHGINVRFKARLNSVGIYSVEEFYSADLLWLKAAFRSINAYYWYTRLRGWEIDYVEFARRSFGNQHATKIDGDINLILPILQKLSEKTGSRMRAANYKAKGINVSLGFQDGTYWQASRTLRKVIFDSRDIYKEALRILTSCPQLKPVRVISESVFDLVTEDTTQLQLFEDVEKRMKLVSSIDEVNDRWGDYSVMPARMVLEKGQVQDRISFGGVKEL